MNDDTYIPNDNFEVSVFITMTEFCHKKLNNTRNLNDWSVDKRKEMIGGSSGFISNDLTMLYPTLSRMYALTVSEIGAFIVKFFRYYIWRDYEPILNSRFKRIGSYY